VTALRVSEAAALSIMEQADYYLEASDAGLAQRWEEAVDKAVHSLLNWPERGALCRFHSASLDGLRWISITGFPKHMIFYRTISQEQTILIIQVLHGARNLETILDEDG
jgi:plasmid stabilization system protein ParE